MILNNQDGNSIPEYLKEDKKFILNGLSEVKFTQGTFFSSF